MLPALNCTQHRAGTGGTPCLLAEYLGMDFSRNPGSPMPITCASGEVCALCACRTAAATGEATRADARPSCVNAGALRDMLYKNLLRAQ
jgi:hypothetical protein